MADVPGEIGVLEDILLDAVPTIILAMVTLIIGYILAYVVGEMVREICCRNGRDRATGMSGLKPSVVAGKIAKALVFAVAAILAIQMLADGGLFGNERVMVENYGIRVVLGLLIIFVGAFVADVVSSAVARWLRRGARVPEDTDPTRELVFLGLIISVMLVGLGVVLIDSLVVLLMFVAFLAIGVVLILLEARRKMWRKI
jgi:hypothetical protein